MNIATNYVNGLTGGQIMTPSGSLPQPSRQPNQIRESTSAMAKPLHLQRLERALDMKPFMRYARGILGKPLSSEDDSAEDSTKACSDNGSENANSRKKCKRLFGTKTERQNIKMHLYNFSELSNDREWLFSTVLSDTESESELSDEDDYIKQLLKSHRKMQKERERYYKTPTNNQYTYYGSGFLSYTDMHPDHQQSIIGVRKRKRRAKNENKSTIPKLQKLTKIRKSRKNIPNDEPESGEIHPSELKNYAFGDTSAVNDDDLSDEADAYSSAALSSRATSSAVRSKSRRSLLASPEVLAARRKRVWQLMCKKEITRCHRLRLNNHKEVIQSSKRVAGMCMKVVRQRAMQSQRVMKETVWRAKRLSREMLGYWKRYERVERDTRKRMEREAEEQRKMDVEIIEAKRQQRKLNFLITQTELYAHFMSKKLGQGTEEEQLRILSQLDDEINPRLAVYDDYDAEHMKQLAQRNAEAAFDTDRALKHQFDVARTIKEEQGEEIKTEPPVKADLPQPTIFKGTLKTYQIKGMTWLANLYDQGISGILADEMGLGKTVQSIAFLCHVAECYGVWGPFLVISPASTLHNWQQELARFVPEFNVVPYWGSPNERKILRQFWEQKDLHTREASFHVVITSYQLIVSDYKYFNRIKWQYMVLDEAQAIKSASSMRWKLLLGFNCRNRLLLSGTPIQNSMAELWALLHFIMPTLFDSHDEFNEWFSKDIESHAENKTGIDEKQISRLHMILKPFMLRRIKKDVENELSDKIEIMVYCPLTIRQKLLYMALKKKIRIEDLLHLTRSGAGSSSDGGHVDRNFTSNLMNLVMQFRKVCNHPELFERRDVKSPFAMRCQEYIMPRLVYDDGILKTAFPSKRHLLYNRFLIYKADHVHRSLFSEPKASDSQKNGGNYSRYVDLNLSADCCFSFTRLSDISTKNLEDVTVGGIITFLQHYRFLLIFYKLLSYRRLWWTNYKPSRFQLLEPMLENPSQQCTLFEDSILKSCIFTGTTGNDSTVYAFGDYIVVNMQETMEHRVIRSKRFKSNSLLNEEADIKDIKKESDIDIMTCDDEVMNIKSQLSEGQSKKLKSATNELLPEFPYIARKPTRFYCEPLEMPKFLYGLCPRVQATRRRVYCESRAAEWSYIRHMQCENTDGQQLVYNSLDICKPRSGWSSLIIPDKQTLVSDAGKLSVLDSLLTRLKSQGHRVLIYSQMTKMIDLLEEYMWHRKHRYMRLDGSSKISARRDMVADFQTRADIFVFLLSTRAGGLGINLTAADTVIFYDSDWNPTVDQQAMDRAHRLGQTKQVTVYRLICKGSIEERILQRAREKSEIQRMVISGGNFKPDTLKPKEVVSLLLDDAEIELKYRQKIEPNEATSVNNKDLNNIDKKMRNVKKEPLSGGVTIPATPSQDDDSLQLNSDKRIKIDNQMYEDDTGTSNSSPSSNTATTAINEPYVPGATTVLQSNDSDNENFIVDCESPMYGADSPTFLGDYGGIGRIRRRHHPRGTKRGRPRGSTRRGGGNGSLPRSMSTPTSGSIDTAKPNGECVITTPTLNTTSDDTHTLALSNVAKADSCFTPTTPTPMKRGPGRPRLKTAGPVHIGIRGAPRTRKPILPLVVPLGHSPAATPLNRSPVMSPAHSERSTHSSATISLSVGSSGSGSSSTNFQDN